MRPIDADALKDAFGERPYNWTDSPEEIQEVCDWENAIDTIDNMLTVDAIPMAWLKTQISEALDDNETELASDIDWLIRKYINEQEEHGI